MERELNPQSLPVNTSGQPHDSLNPTQDGLVWDSAAPVISLPMLVLLMLLPWLWVSVGLLVIGDYRLTIVTYELVGCALPAYLYGVRTEPFLPLRCNLLWVLGVAVALGVVIITVYFASNGFAMDWSRFHQQALNTRLSVQPSFWLFAAVIGLVNPFLEEAFWRGLIYRGWKAHVGTNSARWISSFFFGAWHWVVLQHYCDPVWAIVLTSLVMVGGLTFCMLYERTQTLGAAVLLHGWGADFPMIFVVYDCVIHHSRVIS